MQKPRPAESNAGRGFLFSIRAQRPVSALKTKRASLSLSEAPRLWVALLEVLSQYDRRRYVQLSLIKRIGAISLFSNQNCGFKINFSMKNSSIRL